MTRRSALRCQAAAAPAAGARRWRCQSAPAQADDLREALVIGLPHQPDAASARAPTSARPTRTCRSQRADGRPRRQRDGDAIPNRRSTATERSATASPTPDAPAQRRRQPRRADLFGRRGARTRSAPPRRRVEAGQADLRGTESRGLQPGRRRLHGRDPQRGAGRAQPQQRRGADGQPRGDQRPLRDRRPHPHRRRPVAKRGSRWRAATLRTAAGQPGRARASATSRWSASAPGELAAAAAAARPARDRRRRGRRRAATTTPTCSPRTSAPARPATTSTSPAPAACRGSTLFAGGDYTDYLGSLPAAPARRPLPQTRPAARPPACARRSRSSRAAAPPRRSARPRPAPAAALEKRSRTERDVIAQVRSAYSIWQAANDDHRLEPGRGRRRRR